MAAAIYWLMGDAQKYYTQIDNSKIAEIESSDEMKYEYTLDAYDEDGDKKEVSFKTSRELKEGAYLCLEILPIRGVVEWAEIQKNDLPAQAQSAFTTE